MSPQNFNISHALHYRVDVWDSPYHRKTPIYPIPYTIGIQRRVVDSPRRCDGEVRSMWCQCKRIGFSFSFFFHHSIFFFSLFPLPANLFHLTPLLPITSCPPPLVALSQPIMFFFSLHDLTLFLCRLSLYSSHYLSLNFSPFSIPCSYSLSHSPSSFSLFPLLFLYLYLHLIIPFAIPSYPPLLLHFSHYPLSPPSSPLSSSPILLLFLLFHSSLFTLLPPPSSPTSLILRFFHPFLPTLHLLLLLPPLRFLFFLIFLLLHPPRHLLL